MKARYAIVVALALAGCSRTPAPGTAWVTYTSADGGFKVELPGRQQVSQQTEPLPTGPQLVRSVRADGPDYSFGVSWMSAPPDADAALLALARANYALRLAGTLQSEVEVTVGSHPGMQWEFEIGQPKGFVTVRAILAKARMYELMATGTLAEASHPDVQRFLDSFQLLE